MNDLRTRVREKIGTVIEKSLDAMIAGDMELNAAFIARAMEWLDGKGQKEMPSGVDPVEAAMQEIRSGRKAGRAMPPLSEDDDSATRT